jgi:hypothetical protein
MHADRELLWEDLKDILSRTQKALDALHAVECAITEGRIQQPNREDSDRLTRLLVLAELLHSELRPWSDAVEVAAHGGNGKRPAPVSAPRL